MEGDDKEKEKEMEGGVSDHSEVPNKTAISEETSSDRTKETSVGHEDVGLSPGLGSVITNMPSD